MKELMPHSWKLSFEVLEDQQHCEMKVHLDAGDRSMSGSGRSARNPDHPFNSRVGEELAAARALHDLAHKLTEDAWATVISFSAGN